MQNCQFAAKVAAFLFPMATPLCTLTRLRTVGGEPPLTDLIADPMTRQLMDSDGVALDHLLTLIADARTRLRQ
jgi:hypothetical protein